MGKYSRPSRTSKLQSLTAQLKVKTSAEELQGQVKEIAKEKNIKLMKPTAKPTKPQPKSAPRVAVTKTKAIEPDNRPVPIQPSARYRPPVKEVEKWVKEEKKVKKTEPATPAQEAVTIELGKTPEEVAKLNIYQKLQIIRSKIADFDIKKSGQNSDKGFVYFELPDYLPMINKLNEQAWLMTKFDMTAEQGILKIFNAEKPEEVLEFTLPTADLKMADANGKEAEGIQVMGGKSTYMRRYLMQIAYEISVKDTVDSRGKAPAQPEEELDPRDIEAINEASDVEHLNTICQSIRQRKGFTKNKALLKHYTEAKRKI